MVYNPLNGSLEPSGVSGDPIYVTTTIPGGGGGGTTTAPVTGQVKIATTGTQVGFPSNLLSNGVIVTANSSNTAVILIGPTGVTNTADGTGNGEIIQAGASVSAAVSNTNLLFINGTAGDWVSFIGS